MENEISNTAMSGSLLARNVFNVCFTVRENSNSFHDEFYAARKKFFTGNRKTVKIGKNEIIRGFDGKLYGKLTRRNLYWKKSANRVALEEAFEQKGGPVLVKRDFRGAIVSRVYFDKSMIWMKSEYYEPRDYANARVIFKPCDSFDGIERFDYDRTKKRYRSTLLYPLPYTSGTAEQSLVNAQFGEPQLLVGTDEGDFCYCPEEEADARRQALQDIGSGTIVLMPAWEVKDGNLAGEEDTEESISFTSLEEYAKIEPREADGPRSAEDSFSADQTALSRAQKITLPGAGLDVNYEDIFSGEAEDEPFDAPVPEEERKEILEAARLLSEEEEIREDAGILEAAQKLSEPEEETSQEAEAEYTNAVLSEDSSWSAETGYQGMVVNGKVSGHGRTQQLNGLTAYEGEYKDGKREGFGSYYYKDGNLCYAGFWKEDKKDGLGVSFRGSDHALHVAKWKDGQPEGFVSLFDGNGDLRYTGRIEDGKKQGAGITYSQEDGTLFVGQWNQGLPTGHGSSFDQDGHLLYTGAWKDGKPNGTGTEFNNKGEIVFSGEWRDGKYHNGILYKKKSQAELDESGSL